MTARLVFVIPVRHHHSVADWTVVQRNLAATLQSVSAQTTTNWECIVVANTGALLPTMPAGCTVCRVDLPLPQMPDRTRDLEAYYDAVRHDKGLRLYHGVRDISPDHHVMVVDFDDFVSCRLARMVAASPDAPGWSVNRGYVWSGGNLLYLHRDFHRLCGTSHIVRRDLYGTLERDGRPDMSAIKRWLGSHIFIHDDLARAGTPLMPLPFPGAVYRIGNPISTSGTGRLLAAMIPPRSILTQPHRALSRLRHFRRVTDVIRREFSLPAAPAENRVVVGTHWPGTKACKDRSRT